MVTLDEVRKLILGESRIRLVPPPDSPEDGQEEGVLLDFEESSGMCMVEVDQAYSDGPHDDCLRECSWDQIDAIL